MFLWLDHCGSCQDFFRTDDRNYIITKSVQEDCATQGDYCGWEKQPGRILKALKVVLTDSALQWAQDLRGEDISSKLVLDRSGL